MKCHFFFILEKDVIISGCVCLEILFAEEWVTSKKTEVKRNRQIETRVQRQVILEDGEVVEDSGPQVSTNTTEDVTTNEKENTEASHLITWINTLLTSWLTIVTTPTRREYICVLCGWGTRSCILAICHFFSPFDLIFFVNVWMGSTRKWGTILPRQRAGRPSRAL